MDLVAVAATGVGSVASTAISVAVVSSATSSVPSAAASASTSATTSTAATTASVVVFVDRCRVGGSSGFRGGVVLVIRARHLEW